MSILILLGIWTSLIVSFRSVVLLKNFIQRAALTCLSFLPSLVDSFGIWRKDCYLLILNIIDYLVFGFDI